MNQPRERLADLGRVHRCIRPFLSKVAAFRKTLETSPAALAELQTESRQLDPPRITKRYHRRRPLPPHSTKLAKESREGHGLEQNVALSSTEEFMASKTKMSSPLLASAYHGIFETYRTIQRHLSHCRESKGLKSLASRSAFGVGICISQTAADISPDEWLQTPACSLHFEDVIGGWTLNELCRLAPLLKKALIPFLLCAVEHGMLTSAAALAEAFFDAFKGQWLVKDFARAQRLATICCIPQTFPERLKHELTPSSLQNPTIAHLAVASGLLDVSMRIAKTDEETIKLLVRIAIEKSLEGSPCGDLHGAARSISRTPCMQNYHSILLLRSSEVNAKVCISQIPTTPELADLVVSIWPFENLKQLVARCTTLNAKLALSIAMSLTAQVSSKAATSWAVRVQERGRLGRADWRYEDLLGEWVDRTPARPVLMQRQRVQYKRVLTHKISKLCKPSKEGSLKHTSHHGRIRDEISALPTPQRAKRDSKPAVCNLCVEAKTRYERGETDELSIL